MDHRPIAVFDSGLGGLTAVRELVRLLPGEELVYFGDTGRVPYGGRSRDTLLKFARQNAAFLSTFSPKCIVVACGTISTTAIDVLRAECDVPVFGVVEPAVAAAAVYARVGVIGTKAAIASGVYEAQLRACAPNAVLHAVPCPLFVPLVENGRYLPDDPVVAHIVADYLTAMRTDGIDALILGCTHYPLLKDAIGQFFGPEVALIDTGAACARAVAASIDRCDRTSGGRRRYFVSADVQDFAALAARFLGGEQIGAVEQVAIEQYES